MKLADRPHILTTNRAYSHVAAAGSLLKKNLEAMQAIQSVCVHAASVHIQVGMCMYMNDQGKPYNVDTTKRCPGNLL